MIIQLGKRRQIFSYQTLYFQQWYKKKCLLSQSFMTRIWLVATTEMYYPLRSLPLIGHSFFFHLLLCTLLYTIFSDCHLAVISNKAPNKKLHSKVLAVLINFCYTTNIYFICVQIFSCITKLTSFIEKVKVSIYFSL